MFKIKKRKNPDINRDFMPFYFSADEGTRTPMP